MWSLYFRAASRGFRACRVNRRKLSSSPCRPGAVESSLQGKTVRIGCASGFWGDTAVSAPQLVHHGNLDFLVADYLSEITMSLLTAAKHKSPEFGYTPDFLHSLKPVLKEIKQKGIRVVANAGGVNLQACAQAITKLAADEGVQLSVATVTGDDLMNKLKDIRALGVKDMDSGLPLPQTLYSMNAYLGAFPIAEALNLGADVVVTGRCVDSALALGPLIHQFGWKNTDFDLLAAGSLAGHMIECGAQVTGGVLTDWERVTGWENIGFPIVECDSQGLFLVTKPEKTGGMVSTATVAEQLVYEIGDPCRYLLPDVSCDFSHVKLTDLRDDRVLVSGAIGKAPPDTYKVSATYADGYRAISISPIIGPKAAEKAHKTAEAILKRTRSMFKHLGLPDYSETNIHAIGSEASYGPASRCPAPREVTLWMGVRHSNKKALELFSREIAPAGTGMGLSLKRVKPGNEATDFLWLCPPPAPGQTTLVGGRPRVSPVLRLFSFLYPKEQLPIDVHLNGEPVKTLTSLPTPTTADSQSRSETVGGGASKELDTGCHSYRLEQLAFLRSGDKGDSANIGVIARDPAFLPYLREALTTEAVAEYFGHLLDERSTVERYELPGIAALNFVLKHSLGGGGVASIRIDPQGKGYAQMLADFELENVPNLIN